MSLRQLIPEFKSGFNPRAVRPAEAIKRVRAPARIEFRSGAALHEVVQAVQPGRCLEVVAAPGAGKSVLLPFELATAKGNLVVHVLPSQFLAADLHDFSVRKGEVSFLVLDVQTEWPTAGVVRTTAALIVAKWLAAGEVVMPDCILYHDESHEADAYTYVVGQLAASLGSRISYVRATATADSGGFPRVEPQGVIVNGEFDEQLSRADWDVHVPGLPWSVTSIDDLTLIFYADEDMAKSLIQQYQDAGVSVIHFHSRMDLAQFRHCAQLLRTSNDLFVVLADRTFRSGFTFPFARVIDAGVISHITVREGRAVPFTRDTLAFEREQTRGRGGRVAGLQTQFYCPNVAAGLRIVDLEFCEMEAAAVIFRTLGFRVPPALIHSACASGPLPRDLSTVLREDTPLSLLSDVEMVDPSDYVNPLGRRSPILASNSFVRDNPLDLRDSRVSSTAAMAHDVGVLGARPVEVPRSGYQEDPVDVLGAMMAPVETVTMEPGKYYGVRGTNVSDASSLAFPDGADSVLKFFAADRSMTIFRGLVSDS